MYPVGSVWSGVVRTSVNFRVGSGRLSELDFLPWHTIFVSLLPALFRKKCLERNDSVFQSYCYLANDSFNMPIAKKE